MFGSRIISSNTVLFAARQHGLAVNRSSWRRQSVRSIKRQPARNFGASARCEQEEKKRQDSFKGQLYESTQQRLDRERAELQRFAQMQKQSPHIQYTAMTITVIVTALGCYFLGTLKPAELPASSTTPLIDSQPPQHNVSPSNLQAAWADFVEIVGRENVSTEQGDLDEHSGSAWSSYSVRENERPFLVVFPSTTEEVSRIMKVCHKATSPQHLEGVCIDFSRMNKIVTLHKDDLDVIVQPAVGWEDLNEELAKEDLYFPVDPGPGAMIGGMVGTGCSGTNAYRYGTMREWVVSLTMVLADGTIIKTRQRPRKSSAGYDLTKLFIGSEGTLGLVTEATLKVTVKPKNESVAVASFPSIHRAAECVAKIVGEGVELAGLEILDDVQMKCINDSKTTRHNWSEAPTLFLKFTGTETSIKEQIKIVQSMAKNAESQSFEFARGKDEMAELWSARKAALWSVMAKKRENDRVWTTDVAVPISKLPDIIEQTKKDIVDNGLLAGICGHVGDGNFHAILLFNDSERAIAEGIVHRMVKRAIEMEGTVSGEHGVGLVKRDYLDHELGESTVDTMRKIKQALDPLGLLNCNKVVRVELPGHGDVKSW
ncbi:D-lactate dehydrogenase [Trichophyton tonsurans CBS 112818]|uniref:D-lactate dehydrogenase (cytochrome) n=1 Tax=Trichophyton tonsurans (strain CBS 112818) TaxID=647933 RepID=F2SAS0_TRIT1|nr:D-lactate dehydrogenase [Trichophyton tonsurans CBS 112818]